MPNPPRLQRAPDDPWLTRRLRDAVAVTQTELAIRDVVLAAYAETIAELWRLVLHETPTAALTASHRRRRQRRKARSLTAAAPPPDPTAMEQARETWLDAIERYLLPVIAAVLGQRAADAVASTLTRAGGVEAAQAAALATIPNRLVEPYWRSVLERLTQSIDEVFDAIRAVLVDAQTRGEPVTVIRDRVARVLQIDTGTQAIRDQIIDVESRLYNATLSASERDSLYARREAALHDQFTTEGRRRRAQGLLRLAEALEARAKREGRDTPGYARLLADAARHRRAAERINPTASQIQDARAVVAAIDLRLYRNPDLSEAERVDLAARRRSLYEQLRASEHGWHYRARRIARTETMAALNGGTVAAARATAETLGTTLYKQWLATPDERTRGTHRVADGQVVPLTQPFAVGGALLMHPGDPTGPAHEVIQCRCTLLLLDEDAATDAESTAGRSGVTAAAYNWVSDCGGLPNYIRRIARHLRRDGMSESRAIATAVNSVKRMCATGDTNLPGVQQVNAKSRAEACRAAEQWERLKACAKARD